MAPTEDLFSKVYKPLSDDDGSKADEDLSSFLKEGGCDTGSWDADALFQLRNELYKGSAMLGYDDDGKALRVVSVAKPVIYDGSDLLIEVFQTFPSKKPKIKCTGISEKFNPLTESCQEACVRALAEEVKFTNVATTDFSQEPHRDVTVAASKKLAGLASEYHLYYCTLAKAKCLEIQADLPSDKITAVDELDSLTNPKTLWWAWCRDESPKEIEDKLEALTANCDFASLIDFHSKIKLGTPGEQIRNDFEVVKKICVV